MSSEKPRPVWDSRPTASLEELRDDPDMWFRGYFQAAAKGWDGKTWNRDFGELQRRDIAILALGDVRGKRILDVACGSGLYMVVLAKMGAVVSGQDLSEKAVAEARATLTRHALQGCLQVGTATRLLFEERSFDAVISGDFMEHIDWDEKRAFVAEVFRVLEPGGTFVVKTPNLTYLRASVVLKRLIAVLSGRSPFGIHVAHTRDNPDNQHHGLATYSRLATLLREQFFHIPEFRSQPLSKKLLPRFLQECLPALPLLWPLFNPDLILVCRKPVFYGYFP